MTFASFSQATVLKWYCDGFTGMQEYLCMLKCVNESSDQFKNNQEIKELVLCMNSENQSNDTLVEYDGKFMNFDKEKQRKFQEHPYLHKGQTLLKIDCDKIKEKKKAYVKNAYTLIKKYFASRCDYEIVPEKGKHTNFQWTSYSKTSTFKKLIQGKQVINHIKNVQAALWEKNGLVHTLREFDKKKMYKFDSNDFHFKTYIMNLQEEDYNEEEKSFMNNENDGIWITKNPKGAKGIGITIFKDLNLLKETVKDLKSRREKIKQYSYIQEYLQDPLLINKRKVDLRGYILIASVDPFVVLYQDGFVRSCIAEYDNDFTVFDGEVPFKHLTNRSFQKKHPDFFEKKNDIMFNPDQFKEKLKEEYNLSDFDLAQMQKEKHKILAYTMMAVKDKMKNQKGVFQLLGIDIIWDKNFNAKLIEFNVTPALYTELKPHRYVNPQLVQSTLDLVLETNANQETLRQKWAQPEKLELGKYEILINEATGYNVLNEYLSQQNGDEV
ncbi:hypothetical protein PPERSA_09407 [Pseudocohnilembus persalinus]|uniref:Tubulin-tyrosine ligase/Tubulin polyglutamylase n=1 Tax=Pseudocohnilembus persalinus TaxID=266149 RepID=A0A0V0R539_PSEPJ|nr:hypothetical protein PPERSA_09407 [Pseudocohnilembus persalinus]|eukprot:KRX09577.1 hypothetical protein PPERSA_09407 [Pseudocohnilembus persalinus]